MLKVATVRRIRSKADGKFHLAIILATTESEEELPRLQEVVVLSKDVLSKLRCLVREGRSFKGFNTIKRLIERTA